MHTKNSKQVSESAAVSGCTKISCVRKAGVPRIRKFSAYEIFWIYSTSFSQLPPTQRQVKNSHPDEEIKWQDDRWNYERHEPDRARRKQLQVLRTDKQINKQQEQALWMSKTRQISKNWQQCHACRFACTLQAHKHSCKWEQSQLTNTGPWSQQPMHTFRTYHVWEVYTDI